MKKISRQQAEELFLKSDVLNTQIRQNKKELRVIMTLSSNKSCHVTYNFKNKEKTYHLDEASKITNNLPLF